MHLSTKLVWRVIMFSNIGWTYRRCWRSLEGWTGGNLRMYLKNILSREVRVAGEGGSCQSYDLDVRQRPGEDFVGGE